MAILKKMDGGGGNAYIVNAHLLCGYKICIKLAFLLVVNVHGISNGLLLFKV